MNQEINADDFLAYPIRVDAPIQEPTDQVPF
jgi:hypothetical protein